MDDRADKIVVFAFGCFAGVAVTAAWFSASINTPDYQKGHADGYNAGYTDGSVTTRMICNNELANSRLVKQKESP